MDGLNDTLFLLRTKKIYGGLTGASWLFLEPAHLPHPQGYVIFLNLNKILPPHLNFSPEIPYSGHRKKTPFHWQQLGARTSGEKWPWTSKAVGNGERTLNVSAAKV